MVAGVTDTMSHAKQVAKTGSYLQDTFSLKKIVKKGTYHSTSYSPILSSISTGTIRIPVDNHAHRNLESIPFFPHKFLS